MQPPGGVYAFSPALQPPPGGGTPAQVRCWDMHELGESEVAYAAEGKTAAAASPLPCSLHPEPMVSASSSRRPGAHLLPNCSRPSCARPPARLQRRRRRSHGRRLPPAWPFSRRPTASSSSSSSSVAGIS